MFLNVIWLLLLAGLTTMTCGQSTNIKEKMATKFNNIVTAFDTFFKDSVNDCQSVTKPNIVGNVDGNTLKNFN